MSVAGPCSIVVEAEYERYSDEICECYRFSKEAIFSPKVAEAI